jgi:Na+-driven multidrug efflux pump
LNILFLAVWDMGVTGYVLSVILGNLITTVFLAVVARLDRVFSIRAVNRRLMKELLWFSLPMVPTTVCWLITDLSDRYMVTYFCGDAINGIYSAAYKIPTVITLVSSIFMQAWQFSAVAESSDETECGAFYSKVFRGYLSVITIGTAGLIFFSLLQFFPEKMVGLFIDQNSAGADDVIRNGVLYARSFSIDYILVPIVFCTNGFFNGCGRSFFSMANNIACTFLFRVPISYFFSIMAGATLFHVGLAAPMASVASNIVALIYLFSGRWRDRKAK